jgi:Zn-dependent protease with chaperone function
VLLGPFVLVAVIAAMTAFGMYGPLPFALFPLLQAFLGGQELPGRAVRPEDEPELAELVRRAAERLGFRALLLVRVVAMPQAALGPARVSGVRVFVLLVGLPLLRALTAGQLAAVVAHEPAHEQPGDRRTEWLLRARARIAGRPAGGRRHGGGVPGDRGLPGRAGVHVRVRSRPGERHHGRRGRRGRHRRRRGRPGALEGRPGP